MMTTMFWLYQGNDANAVEVVHTT